MDKRTASSISKSTLYRSATLDMACVDDEKRTVGLTFSSEQPVMRRDAYGDQYLEVLDHTEVDQSRMEMGAPLLYDHEHHIGTVEKYSFGDARNGKAIVRFGRGAMASEKFQDVKDGILRQTSVGYDLQSADAEKDGERDGIPIIRFRKWLPMEVTLTPLGADKTVGVPRTEERTTFSVRSLTKNDETSMKRTLLHDAQPNDGNGPNIITHEDFSSMMDEGQEILLLAARYQADYPELIRDAQRAIKDKWGIRKWQSHLLSVTTKPATARGAEVIASATGVRGDCSVGGRFVNSERYREMVKGGLGRGRHVEVEIAGAYGFRSLEAPNQRVTFGISTSDVSASADLGGTSGAGIDIIRQPWNLLNQQPLNIADLFAQGTTGGDVVRYIRELSYTQAAARVAEAGPKPQAQLDVGVVNGTVEKTAVYVDVSEEMMNDWQQAGSFINSRLSYMVQAKEDSYLLNGTGSSEITGILNFTGIQTVSGAVNTVDNLLRAKAYVEGANGAGFAMPDAYVMNPLDYLNVRLTKDANGQYLLGGPGYAPYGVGGYTNVGQLWGLPVVTSVFLTQGTAIVGAFKMGAQIFRRAGVTIRTTDSDGSKFLSNIITVVAESRFMLACYQPNRFCTITGIPSVP